MANQAAGYELSHQGDSPYSCAIHAYLSAPMLDKIQKLVDLRSSAPLHGFFFGYLEPYRFKNVVTLTSSVLVKSKNWDERVGAAFSEEDFLEAFGCNHLKFGNRQLLGWFSAGRDKTFPDFSEASAHKRFFRHSYQIFIAIDVKRQKTKAYRFFNNQPVPVPLRIYEESGPSRVMKVRKRVRPRLTPYGLKQIIRRRDIWNATTQIITIGTPGCDSKPDNPFAA